MDATMKESKTNRRYVYIASGILGILFFSSKAVMVKMAYLHQVGTLDVLLLRMTFALPLYFASAVHYRLRHGALSFKTNLFIFLFGFLGYYLASYFDLLGLQYIKASLERLILFVYPSIVLLMSYFFLQKEIKKEQIIALVITYIGLAMVFVPELQSGDSKNVLLGGTLIFLSALTYASYIVGSGWLIPKVGAARFTSCAMSVSSFLVIVHYFLEGHTLQQALSYSAEVYWIGAAMAIIATVIPSYMVSFAIKGLGSNQFAIFGSLGPVSTIVLAYLFLGEHLTGLQVLGGVIIVSGVMYTDRNKNK